MDRRMLALAGVALLAGCLELVPDGPDPAPTASEPETAPIVTPIVAEPPAQSTNGSDPAWSPGLYHVALDVQGQQAQGLLMVPDAVPSAIAVVAHGWGGSAAGHEEDLRALASLGAVAVAMDYRGAPDAFKVQAGVDDTIAATRFLQRAYPDVGLVLLYGWSMGGEVAMLAPVQDPNLFDYVFIGSGVSDLETFWDASPLAQEAIEDETGGRPDEAPEEYTARSPVDQAAAFAQSGVKRVFLVHAGADAIVPIEHSERLFTALGDAGQPVSFYVVTKNRAAGPCLAMACLPDVVHPANHEAGEYRLLEPFIEHRIAGLPDPDAPAVRGTYDADTGTYDPSDVG